MSYQYALDTARIGDLRLRRSAYETLYAAERELRDALDDWSRRTLDNTAREQMPFSGKSAFPRASLTVVCRLRKAGTSAPDSSRIGTGPRLPEIVPLTRLERVLSSEGFISCAISGYLAYQKPRDARRRRIRLL